jgi:hypothetical protein
VGGRADFPDAIQWEQGSPLALLPVLCRLTTNHLRSGGANIRATQLTVRNWLQPLSGSGTVT